MFTRCNIYYVYQIQYNKASGHEIKQRFKSNFHLYIPLEAKNFHRILKL